MVGASKILTVSYGTFSCTLEGFDDPFSTMRSIAEYFRDLAADDRYFGAEPPTPDAEMLHRIAEKEVQRRVESRVGEDGIVLRQVEAHEGLDDADAAAPSSSAAKSPVPEVDLTSEEARDSYAEDEEAALNAEARSSDAPDAPEVGDDSVAAKLSRIRAVVARSPSDGQAEETATPFAGSIDSAFADAEDADWEEVVDTSDAISVETTSDDALAFDDPFAKDQADTAGSEAEAMAEMEQATEAEDMADLAALDSSPSAEAENDTEDASPDPVEQEQQQDAQLGLAARIVKLKRAAAEMNPERDAGEALTDTGTQDAADADAPSDMAPTAGADPDDGENLFDGAFEDVPEDIQSAETALEAASDDYDDADETSEEPKSALATIAEAREAVTNDEATPEADESAETRDDHANRLADFDADSTGENALDRILEQTNSRMDDSEGSRRRSAIAHLKAAVAATKADRLLNRDTNADDDVAQVQSAYRNDLAQVVQSQPEAAAEDAASEDVAAPDADPDSPFLPDAGEQATPLVLVSDQRVDVPDATTAADTTAYEDEEDLSVPDASILPRRVNQPDGLSTPTAEATEEGFADFAEKLGVSELPDLLEAAAAYTAFVEGNKLFSRPQLMRRVASFETGDEFTREAGLRSFGQLLRQGKIQKLKRGQFTITEETRFNPEARMAGE